MLSARDIFVSYERDSTVNQIDGASLSIVPGEIVAIVGPNGSGKSTFIRALSRVLEPRRGAVLLNSEDLYKDLNARSAAIAISVAPQDTHIAFGFTAREVVAMGRAPHRTGWALFADESSADRNAIDNALAQAQITPEQAMRPVMTLSGGERQRVLIARAIVQDSAIILLDEPASSLDLAHRIQLFDRLRALAADGNKAVVVVLHDLSQAADLADRLVLLKEGRVVADGPVSEVLTHDSIWDVYKCDVRISRDIATGRIIVSPAASFIRKTLTGLHVLVMCGGGGGIDVLRELHARGADVCAGDLREGDVDLIAAHALGISYNRTGSFESIKPISDHKINELAQEYKVICFVPSSVGPANMEMIKAAIRLAEAGASVYTLKRVADSIVESDGQSSTSGTLWFSLIRLLRLPPFESVGELIDVLSRSSNA